MEVCGFTQNDTLDPLIATLKDSKGNVVDLTDQTVVFILEDCFTGKNKVDEKAAEILDAAAGLVQFNWEPEDIDTAGTYWAYFVRLKTIGSALVKRGTHPRGKQLQVIIERTPQDVEEPEEPPA